MATITKLTQIAYSEGLTHKAVREAINSNSTKADTNFANLNTENKAIVNDLGPLTPVKFNLESPNDTLSDVQSFINGYSSTKYGAETGQYVPIWGTGGTYGHFMGNLMFEKYVVAGATATGPFDAVARVICASGKVLKATYTVTTNGTNMVTGMTLEGIEEMAEVAQSVLEDLQRTADDAMEMATGAADVAGTANSKAEAAQTAAEAADSKAQTAQTAASAAAEAANEAKSTAQTATEKANQASTTAKLAGDTATEAKNTANTAKQTADAASTAATEAKSTANNANATANAANSKAADAEETALDALALAQMTNGQAVMAQFDTMPLGAKTMDSNVNYDVATLPTSGVTIEFYQSVNIGGKVRQKGVFVAKTASRYYVNWKAEPIQGIADSRLFNDGRQTTADTNPQQYLIAGSFAQTNGIQAGSIFICRATGRMVIKDTTGSDGWKYLDSTHWPE